MIADPVEQSDYLLAHGRVAEAVLLIERSAALGDADALFRNAMWKLAGQPVPRDLPGARILLRRATAIGNIDAALIEVALTGNGSGAPADWIRANALLEKAARSSHIAAKQLAMLRRMRLEADGMPAGVPDVRKIGDRPNVWHAEQLFTPEECRHVAENAADLLQPAVVVDPKTGHNIASPVRTSDGAVIGPTRETLVIQALNQRIAAISGTHVRQGEALAVLRYRSGQQFRPHLDVIGDTNNQRVKTVLVYLNEGFTGGSTFFTHSKLRIAPRVGDAIIFDNVSKDGSIDPAAQHAGEQVTRGVKWLATRWIRGRSFDVWKGPEAID